MGLSLAEMVALLEVAKHDRICLSCWAEIIAEYLDENLSEQTMNSTMIHVMRPPKNIWLNIHHHRHLRTDALPLTEICQDCLCDKLSAQSMIEEEKALAQQHGGNGTGANDACQGDGTLDQIQECEPN